MTDLTPADRERLVLAKHQLTAQSVASRVADLIGTPIEKGLAMLPQKARGMIDKAAGEAIQKALEVAILTLGEGSGRPTNARLNLAFAALTGGVGGLFGLPALIVELPVSTTLMLRAIAEIARHQGEDLADLETRLACMQVFALGGPQASDDAADTSYYATRLAIGRLTSDAARHLLTRGAAAREAPAVVRFISAVAARFGLVVTEKALAAALPAIGAVGGAAVNTIFMDHFQELARGHFTVRSLERTYGEARVKTAFEEV